MVRALRWGREITPTLQEETEQEGVRKAEEQWPTGSWFDLTVTRSMFLSCCFWGPGSWVSKVQFLTHSLLRAWSLASVSACWICPLNLPTLLSAPTRDFCRSHSSLKLNAETYSVGGFSCLTALTQPSVTLWMERQSFTWPQELCRGLLPRSLASSKSFRHAMHCPSSRLFHTLFPLIFSWLPPLCLLGLSLTSLRRASLTLRWKLCPSSFACSKHIPLPFITSITN